MSITILIANRSIFQKTYSELYSISPPSPANYNDAVTFNITVTPQTAGVAAPDFGYVKVYDANTNQLWGDGYIAISGSAAINKTLPNKAGSYDLIVKYDGYLLDPSATYADSKTATFTYIINHGNVDTVTTLSIDSATFSKSLNKNVVAKVVGGATYPSGVVIVDGYIIDGYNIKTYILGFGGLVHGVFPNSISTITIPAGKIPTDGYWYLRATYEGDGIYLNPSTSNTLLTTVTSQLSTSSVLSGPITVGGCMNVTYNIIVTSSHGTVDGHVTLYAKNTSTVILATGTLSGGVAALFVNYDNWSSEFDGGDFSVYAICTGSSSFANSTTNSINVHVSACKP